jgi:hypothetical protein
MQNFIEITDCWLIANRLLVVEIKHDLAGLPKDSLITDGKNSWHIATRIFFGHTLHQQKKLENETISHSRFSFKDQEARSASIKHVLDSETKGIYQYTLKELIKIEKGIYSIQIP